MLLFYQLVTNYMKKQPGVFIGPHLTSSHSAHSKHMIFDTDCPSIATTYSRRPPATDLHEMAIINRRECVHTWAQLASGARKPRQDATLVNVRRPREPVHSREPKSRRSVRRGSPTAAAGPSSGHRLARGMGGAASSLGPPTSPPSPQTQHLACCSAEPAGALCLLGTRWRSGVDDSPVAWWPRHTSSLVLLAIGSARHRGTVQLASAAGC